MAKQIDIYIENGSARVETRGFIGKACQDATAELEKAMGRTVSDTPTPEMHQREVRQVNQ